MSAELAYAFYAAIALCAVVLDLLRRAHHSLTFGRFLRCLAVRRPSRLVLLAVWAWLGWHVLVRGSVTFLR